jgi:hypothetical protein
MSGCIRNENVGRGYDGHYIITEMLPLFSSQSQWKTCIKIAASFPEVLGYFFEARHHKAEVLQNEKYLMCDVTFHYVNLTFSTPLFRGLWGLNFMKRIYVLPKNTIFLLLILISVRG